MSPPCQLEYGTEDKLFADVPDDAVLRGSVLAANVLFPVKVLFPDNVLFPDRTLVDGITARVLPAAGDVDDVPLDILPS